jgi:hypothetical protein
MASREPIFSTPSNRRQEDSDMDIEKGDRVLVNLAPFIGSERRSKESIPCRVLALDKDHVEVRTEHPFREFSLRVLTTWIEGKLESDQEGVRSRVRSSSDAGVRQVAASVIGYSHDLFWDSSHALWNYTARDDRHVNEEAEEDWKRVSKPR